MLWPSYSVRIKSNIYIYFVLNLFIFSFESYCYRNLSLLNDWSPITLISLLDGRVLHQPELTVPLEGEPGYHPLDYRGVLRVHWIAPIIVERVNPHNSKTWSPWRPSARSRKHLFLESVRLLGLQFSQHSEHLLEEPQYTGQVFLWSLPPLSWRRLASTVCISQFQFWCSSFWLCSSSAWSLLARIRDSITSSSLKSKSYRLGDLYHWSLLTVQSNIENLETTGMWAEDPRLRKQHSPS